MSEVSYHTYTYILLGSLYCSCKAVHVSHLILRSAASCWFCSSRFPNSMLKHQAARLARAAEAKIQEMQVLLSSCILHAFTLFLSLP